MKKFYYKKDVSLDKTPIVLRLERRHTMDKDKNGKEYDNSRVTSRTNSVSSVHLLRDESAISKAKTREITKSLSEDVLSKGHVKKSAKVITETDLSSSWLYKARKASMNSKDSPQKMQQSTGLSPVALTDPKLKPVAVKSSARTKKHQSCLCYFAVMMAISVCTIGVLAIITGILYNEMFSFKNLTSAETSESVIDISNLIPESRSLNDNYIRTNEYNFINETIQQSLESTDNISAVSGNGTSNLYEDKLEENIHIAGAGNLMNVTDVNRLLDSRKLELKFKDGDTIIYELNSSSSSEYVKHSNSLEIEELDSNENKVGKINEPSTFKDIKTWSDEGTDEKINELENLETFINLQSKRLNDIVIDNEQDKHQLNEIFNPDELKENSVDSSSNVTFENEIILGLKNNESEMYKAEESEPFVPKLDVGYFYGNENESVIPERSDNVGEKLESNDLNNFKMDKQESEPEMYEVERLPVFKNTDTKLLASKSDHNVDSMLLVINETEEESSNTVSNRNGELSPSIGTLSLFEVKNNIESPVEQLKTLRSQEQEISIQEAQQMKPLDMKVSLAEAMKHLQALDVNNKLLTSRIKSVKPKSQNTQQTKLSENPRNKQNITIEKIKYLQNLRLVLEENLLRI